MPTPRLPRHRRPRTFCNASGPLFAGLLAACLLALALCLGGLLAGPFG